MISDYINKKVNFTYSKILVKISKQIYFSSTSKIFLCTDVNNTAKTYCLKITSTHLEDKPTINSTYSEIATLLALKEKQNIVQILDHYSQEVNGSITYYLLMEYCGVSLAETMQSLSKEKNSFSEGQIWKILHQVSLGLVEIHANKTAHRDIRPENILTTLDGSYKICDFKSVTNKFYETVTNSSRNEIIFDISRNTSQSVRAPEQSDLYTGYPINEKVDIWALGLLLYRLLFESAPFCRDYTSVLKNFSNDTIELSEEMTEYYSPDIITILKQMLKSHPKQRISPQQIVKFIESKKDNLFGQKVSNLKKRTFSITTSVNDATVKIFKRHSTIFWVIKLTHEDLLTYPKLKYIKLLVNKAWTKKFKVNKLFQAISTRPIHYCSYVALKTMYILHSYIFLGPREVLTPPNFNLQDFLAFFSNIWYSRYSSANYDKDEVLKNAHVTKFIISYADFIKTKIIFHLRYTYIENNYSVENLITKEDFDFSLLLDKTFISDILSLYSLVYQKLIQVPICLTNIAKTTDVVLQILNEEMLSLFNFIFFLLVGYKNYSCNTSNNLKVFDSQFYEITNKARDYMDKLKKFRQEINSKNIFLDFPGDSPNCNVYSDYLNALDENLKFFPKKDYNIKELFSTKDIIGIKLSPCIGNMIQSNVFFDNQDLMEISRGSIISNYNYNEKEAGDISPKSVSVFENRVSAPTIDNRVTENSKKKNFEFSEEKFLNSNTKFDFGITNQNIQKICPFEQDPHIENKSNNKGYEPPYSKNYVDLIDSPSKKDNKKPTNPQSLFDQNFFSKTYNPPNEKPNDTESKNSEESLNNLNTNVLDVLNEIFESNKGIREGNFKHQEQNEKKETNKNINSNTNTNTNNNMLIDTKFNNSRKEQNLNNPKNENKNDFTGKTVNTYTTNNNNNTYTHQAQTGMKNIAVNYMDNLYNHNHNNNYNPNYNNQMNPMTINSHMNQPFNNNNNYILQHNYLQAYNAGPFDMFSNRYTNYYIQAPYMQGYYNYNHQGMNPPYVSNSNLSQNSNIHLHEHNKHLQAQVNPNPQIGNNSGQNKKTDQNKMQNIPVNDKEEFESVSSQFPQMSIINIQNNFNDIKVFKEVNIETLANDFLKEEFSKKNLQWLISSKDINYGKQIGFGGSSEVFRADYRGTEVAVKKLRILEVKEENLKEFKREVSSLIMLRHPNLVLFMGAIAEKDNICIVTEYCAGGTLFNMLHQKKDLIITWELRLRILIEIAVGINFLHTNSPPIIHRDLKSLNILLTEQIERPSDNTRVKISDFGLSKIIDTFDGFKEQMTGQLGTCHWMAPEVIENKHYTLKADVFSYGIIIWETLTRKTPYHDMSQQQISFYVTVKKGRPDKSFIPSNTPPPLIKLMESCWDVEPNNRPSFEDIISYLKKIKL